MSRRDNSASSERLGVYVDDVYTLTTIEGQRRISGDRAFVLFVSEVGSYFAELILFGRAVDSDTPADYVLSADVGLAPLPYYRSVRHVHRLAAVVIRTARQMWRGLDDVDLVWVFGPHPFALILAMLARLRRRRIVFGVRQDTVEYFRARLPSRRWAAILVPIRVLDLVFRMVARRVGVTVVGETIARQYPSEQTLAMKVTLVREADVAAAPPALDWNRPIELLTISRLDAEKNPFLLVDALGELEAGEPGKYRLTWVGRGPLLDEALARAAQRGVHDLVRWVGYVPHGPEIFELFRRSHVFVHVSLTEGVPQVLIEALACGVPIVATDVGGVRDAVGSGDAALLVPPRDRDALVAAIRVVVAESSVRERLESARLEVIAAATLEHEARRVAHFVAAPRAGTRP